MTSKWSDHLTCQFLIDNMLPFHSIYVYCLDLIIWSPFNYPHYVCVFVWQNIWPWHSLIKRNYLTVCLTNMTWQNHMCYTYHMVCEPVGLHVRLVSMNLKSKVGSALGEILCNGQSMAVSSQAGHRILSTRGSLGKLPRLSGA